MVEQCIMTGQLDRSPSASDAHREWGDRRGLGSAPWVRGERYAADNAVRWVSPRGTIEVLDDYAYWIAKKYRLFRRHSRRRSSLVRRTRLRR